jgi:hypothetical protein
VRLTRSVAAARALRIRNVAKGMPMRRLMPLCLIPALALGACDNNDAPDVNEAQAEAVIDNVQQAPERNVPRGLPISEERAAPPGALPPQFEGRWGITPADCDVARSDTRGLLVIRASTLTFHAASATAKVIGGPSRYKVIADLTFSGKGAVPTRRDQLELTSAGTVLQRSEPSGKTYRYERC